MTIDYEEDIEPLRGRTGVLGAFYRSTQRFSAKCQHGTKFVVPTGSLHRAQCGCSIGGDFVVEDGECGWVIRFNGPIVNPDEMCPRCAYYTTGGVCNTCRIREQED